MKKVAFIVLILVIVSLLLFFLNKKQNQIVNFISPLAKDQKNIGPLSKYAFDKLAQNEYKGSEIKVGKVIRTGKGFTSYMFYYTSGGKKVSGLLNIPKTDEPADGFPVIVMVRGYVDNEIYDTGVGTQKPAEYFATNGFITLAPDFLGFGQSDDTYPDILEDRFVRPVTVLDLLASIKNLKQANPNKVGIWGHSNGGQITISVLEILGMMKNPTVNPKLPVVLWAPVTEGFPESVTTYMTEMTDLGLQVKIRINQFQRDYDCNKYSISTYLSNIKSNLEVHQGTGDEYIEVPWTDAFVNKLKSFGREVNYYKYDGDNHNLSTNWDTAVTRSLDFFRKGLVI